MSGPRLRDATNDPPKPSAKSRGPRYTPPGWLSAPAKAAFRRILLDLSRERPDVIERTDIPALALMAESYAVAQAAAKAMRAPGNVPAVLEVDAVHGGHNRKTPAWQVYNQAAGRYLTLAREFGLTLAARTRLELPGIGAPLEDDQDEDLEDAL